MKTLQIVSVVLLICWQSISGISQIKDTLHFDLTNVESTSAQFTFSESHLVYKTNNKIILNVSNFDQKDSKLLITLRFQKNILTDYKAIISCRDGFCKGLSLPLSLKKSNDLKIDLTTFIGKTKKDSTSNLNIIFFGKKQKKIAALNFELILHFIQVGNIEFDVAKTDRSRKLEFQAIEKQTVENIIQIYNSGESSVQVGLKKKQPQSNHFKIRDTIIPPKQRINLPILFIAPSYSENKENAQKKFFISETLLLSPDDLIESAQRDSSRELKFRLNAEVERKPEPILQWVLFLLTGTIFGCLVLVVLLVFVKNPFKRNKLTFKAVLSELGLLNGNNIDEGEFTNLKTELTSIQNTTGSRNMENAEKKPLLKMLLQTLLIYKESLSNLGLVKVDGTIDNDLLIKSSNNQQFIENLSELVLGSLEETNLIFEGIQKLKQENELLLDQAGNWSKIKDTLVELEILDPKDVQDSALGVQKINFIQKIKDLPKFIQAEVDQFPLETVALKEEQDIDDFLLQIKQKIKELNERTAKTVGDYYPEPFIQTLDFFNYLRYQISELLKNLDRDNCPFLPKLETIVGGSNKSGGLNRVINLFNNQQQLLATLKKKNISDLYANDVTKLFFENIFRSYLEREVVNPLCMLYHYAYLKIDNPMIDVPMRMEETGISLASITKWYEQLQKVLDLHWHIRLAEKINLGVDQINTEIYEPFPYPEITRIGNNEFHNLISLSPGIVYDLIEAGYTFYEKTSFKDAEGSNSTSIDLSEIPLTIKKPRVVYR